LRPAPLWICVILSFMFAKISFAGDWLLENKVTEKSDFNDNVGLQHNPDGFVLGSLTSLSTDAIYSGHDFRFDLIGDVSYRHYFGPAADDFSDVLSPKISTKFNKRDKTSSFDFAASISRTEASAVEDLELIQIPIETYRDTLSANTSFTQTLGPRNSVGLRASLQNVVFEKTVASLTPSTFGSAGLFWTEKLTKRTDLMLSTDASWLVLDDRANTNRETVAAQLALTSQLSPRLKFHAGIGPKVTFSQFDDIVFPINGRQNTEEFGWIGDLRADYTYKLGTVSVFASRAVEPSSRGDLQSRSTFGLLTSHKINEVSDFNFSMQYRLAETGTSEAQSVLIISPTYSRKLTDEWSMQTGYQFTYANDDAADAKSNNLFVSVSKALVISP
jgi:hypothetical protein